MALNALKCSSLTPLHSRGLIILRKILHRSATKRSRTVCALNENAEHDERVEYSPEDLTTVILNEADEPLVVDLARCLWSCPLNCCHLAELSERRVTILWISHVSS